MKVLGMMSGTSVDSVDSSIIEISHENGQFHVELLYFGSYPFPETLKEKIEGVIRNGKAELSRICGLNFELGKFYGEAAKRFVSESGIRPQLAANHGQTVYHIPRKMAREGLYPSTLQIGEPAFIAFELGVPVVSDFRPADIAAGGEGAPLVPMADYIMFHRKDSSIAIHNIGGISNITYLPADRGVEGIVAFDTGPGNTLIDNAMKKLFGRDMDRDGEVARKGKVNRSILNRLMEDPYFKLEPPKSTGREKFNIESLPDELWKLSPEDIIATLTAFTAESIALAYKKFIIPHGLDEVLVAGGGIYNRTLMEMIAERLHPIPVKPLSSIGFNPKARESAAFAVLGYLTYNGMWGNVPAATGAKRFVVLGKISYPHGGYRTTKR